MRRALLAVALLAACGDFEDPEIVIDLRVLGMQVDPPEVVAPVDPEEPTQIDVRDLEDSTVCALVGDPTADRRLTWSMTSCPPTNSGRCDNSGAPQTLLGEGALDDPELGDEAPVICARLGADGNLLAILMESFDVNDLLGFGGISAQIELRVEPEGGGDPVFGTKRMRYAPQVPIDRVANQNPHIAGLTATFEDETVVDMPEGRCRDVEPVAVAAGAEIKLEPVESETDREDYVLPTIDGGRVELTENITYRWHSTAGAWQRHVSGGPRDPVGNEPQLFSRWTAPSDPAIVGAGLDVELWLVYRDERGGGAWLQSCVTVTP